MVGYNSAPSLCIRGVDRENSAFCLYLTFRLPNMRAMSKVKSRGCEPRVCYVSLRTASLGLLCDLS